MSMSISLFCDHISVLDIAYFDKTKGLVGASFQVNVEFVGKPDDEGILIDFSLAKKAVKKIIDDICDHRFVLPKSMAQIQDDRFQLELSYGVKNQQLYYEGPTQALCEIPAQYVSSNHIASYLEQEMSNHFGSQFEQVKIQLEEVKLGNKPILNYTHGLKQHYGNCQRLFHGHHNSVDIWVNEEPRPDLESWLVRDHLKSNIHFCFSENIINKEQVMASLPDDFGIPTKCPFVEIQYQGNQGMFRAVLPSEEIYVLPIESTVENLSSHFAKVIRSQTSPKDRIKVKAYEGINKGAISYLS